MLNRFERFLFGISEIDRYWHKIAADVMEEYGLKGAYAVYFTALSKHPEGISAAQLGEMCGRDKSDVSRAVSAMEKKALAERQSETANQYRARVVLTEAGRQVAEKVNRKAMLAVQLGGDGLTDEQRETFTYALLLIASNLQKLSQEGLPNS